MLGNICEAGSCQSHERDCAVFPTAARLLHAAVQLDICLYGFAHGCRYQLLQETIMSSGPCQGPMHSIAHESIDSLALGRSAEMDDITTSIVIGLSLMSA